jgi:hypothetical protein
VKQILVIDNAELWIALNREFAGMGDLRISETATWESGIRLAKVEWLELIICSCNDSRPSPIDLAAALVSEGIDLERVICVVDPGAFPASSGKPPSKLRTCLPDQLVDTVSAILSAKTSGASTGFVAIDLLAQCEFTSSQPGEATRGFVNLVGIDEKSLRFESSGPLNVGDVISMTFVLPRSAAIETGNRRVKIELLCTVHSCLNLDKFSYRGEFTKIFKLNAEAVKEFLLARAPKVEN